MRKYILPISVAATAVLSCTGAMASDGTITFSGNLTSNTCAVSAASASLSVTLPTLAIAALPSDGTTAGNTPFSLSVTGCPNTVNTATAYFEANANVDTTTGYLKNTGVATNVELKLTNASGSAIDLSKPSGSQNVTGANISGGATTANFAVEYIAKGGAATAGSVSSSITYSMIYN